MKIAVCSTGDNKEALVASRFARCNYFMIYDHETSNATFIENNSKNEASGAGGKVSKYLSDLDVSVVLVPQVGPKAYDALNAFEIEAYEYLPNITVQKALKDFSKNEYSIVTEAKGKSKH